MEMNDNDMIVQQETTHNDTAIPNAAPTPEPHSHGSLRGLLILTLIGAVVLAVVIYTGIRSRANAASQLQHSTATLSVPVVSVVHPKIGSGIQELVVPGNMQAFTDTPIWARANGYLKSWYVDIGARVKQGQLLGDIESPETDEQLQQVREQLSVAEANLKLAQITADRYKNLFQTDSVSKQDVDNAVQDAAAKTAALRSAQANVNRLQELVGYEKITAPFNGVITARNIDVGALVNAGAAPGHELFHMASISTLRVYVEVPEVYSRSAKPGVAAYLTLTEFPGRRFHGTVVRNANAINPASRTLLVEVDVKNPMGELLPGSYASVHLKLPSKVEALTVPVNTLLFRSEGLRVAVVRNGRAELRPVIMGRDFGEDVELVSGIQEHDLVITNPPDSIVSGQAVQTAQ
jgi:RND family efflux transporter MFP subunit